MEENKDLFIIIDDNTIEEQATEPTEVIIESEVVDEIVPSDKLEVLEEIVEQEPTIAEVTPKVDEEAAEPEPAIQEEQLEASPSVVDAQYVATLFEQMMQKYDSKIAVDEHKSQLFDKMYGELKSLRDDQFSKAIKPIFMDLIVMVDNINKMASKYSDDLEGEELQAAYKRLKINYKRLGENVQDLLYNYGIEPFESSAGEAFSSRRQQVKKSSENPDVEDKTIIESLYPGYYWDEIMLRKEGVHINIKKEKE
ncbi:MAG: nucleotide exchange factor GrpE [Rikenellaceae bacterium]